MAALDLLPEGQEWTQEELREKYESSYLMEETFGSFENYQSFIQEYYAVTDELSIREQYEELGYNPFAAAFDPETAELNAKIEQDITDATAELFDRYGIPQGAFVDKYGNTFDFVGGRFNKIDDPGSSLFWDVIGAIAEAVTVTGLTGGLAQGLTGVLTSAGLSPAVANTVATGITNIIAGGGEVGSADIFSLVGNALGLDVSMLNEAGEFEDDLLQQMIDNAVNAVQDVIRNDQEETIVTETSTKSEQEFDPEFRSNYPEMVAQGIWSVILDDGTVVYGNPDPDFPEQEIPMPEVTKPTEETDEEVTGGGGAEQSPETQQQPAEEQTVTDTERVGDYVYEGNGIFRDVVDGDVWYVPNPVGVSEGDYVNDEYMETNNATVFNGDIGEFVPPTDETGAAAEEEEVVDIITEAVVDSTVDDEVTDTTEEEVTDTTEEVTDTTEEVTDTTEEVTDTTEKQVTEEVADGTEDGVDESTDGKDGTDGTDGTDDGTDGDEGSDNGDDGKNGDTKDGIDSGALAAATGMLGATQFKPFMSGITYEAPQIPQLIQTPQKDYVAALDGVIKRSLFEGIV